MKSRVFKLAALAFLIAAAMPLLFEASMNSAPAEPALVTGIGDPSVLKAKYEEWKADYVKNGGDTNLAIALDWSKGLSSQHVREFGVARLDLTKGTVRIKLKGSPDARGWDVWATSDALGAAEGVTTESGEGMLYISSLNYNDGYASLEASLGPDTFTGFDLDKIVVTPEGKTPQEDRLLVGSTTLFHKLYWSQQRNDFSKLYPEETEPAPNRGLIARLMEKIMPSAQAQLSEDTSDSIDDTFSRLVAKGRSIFFNETFNGNGRTCGTCHRENNNLTIDPVFIATLQPTDKLFVAEFEPALAQNFENPVLMRNVGLILENVDGFGDLANKFTMRSVPHTLAMRTSLNPSPGDGSTTPPNQRTGWSGDGAPFNEIVILSDGTALLTTGTLRDFAIGAVRQHFTKTLNRNPFGGGGSLPDFRFPTSAELNALEAFQLSTGRQTDLQLPLNLLGPLPALGQTKFMTPFVPGGATCNVCHVNAGANFQPVLPSIQNRNFDTNVEDLPNPPGHLFGQLNPPDGGFGGLPCTGPGGGPPCGNNTFNTPPLVEAADTAPFFHNNAVNTIEGAVLFYQFGIPASFGTMNVSDVQAIASFLRAVNALENIRSAIAFEERAKLESTLAGAAVLINLAIADTDDGVDVLNDGSLHSDAAFLLTQAIGNLQMAAVSSNQGVRNDFIQKAINQTNLAKSKIQGP